MSLVAKIKIGYSGAKKLLISSNISFTENTVKKLHFSKANYSSDFLELSQGDDYRKIYYAARKNYDFDLLLWDQSIFQFSYEVNDQNEINKLRYAYFEPPNYIIPYEDFLKELNLDYGECGDIFYEEYEQYKSEAKLKQSVTPVRYDYDADMYTGLRHPISHLHIGHNNKVRIPMSFIFSPKAFVAFIIRQIYYDKWKYLLNDKSYLKAYSSLKSVCIPLGDNVFNNQEKNDFFII